jgi:UDP-3-O-[3-hydroxymyristoyl] glucosamine N-acyltransferase
VGVVGHIKIADRTSVGAQSGISKGVFREGTALFGSPAIEYTDQLKSIIVYRKLPQMLRRIEEMEKQLLQLELKSKADSQ